jgi:hypothetical protein
MGAEVLWVVARFVAFFPLWCYGNLMDLHAKLQSGIGDYVDPEDRDEYKASRIWHK